MYDQEIFYALDAIKDKTEGIVDISEEMSHIKLCVELLTSDFERASQNNRALSRDMNQVMSDLDDEDE